MSERTFEEVRYPFTPAEMDELRDQLAAATQKEFELESQKSEASSSFNQLIKEAANLRAGLARKIEARFEMRQVEVLVVMDQPRPGWKQFIDVNDPRRVVAEREMTPEERQGSLFGEQ